jgi:hypothetical protein
MGWKRGCGEMEACLRQMLGEAARLRETALCVSDAPGEVGRLESPEQLELARATDYVAVTVAHMSARLIRIRATLARMGECQAGGRLGPLILADEQ